MAAILVDYENVGMADGLKGVEWLGAGDSLHIFYSQRCSRIRAEYVHAVEQCGCGFHIHRLLNPRKNALDFYIASECGILSRGGEGQVAIVSNDKGLLSVADFFRARKDEFGTTVAVAHNIEDALLALDAPGDAGRRALLRERAGMLDLAAEHARIGGKGALMEKAVQSFAGTEYEGLLPQICGYLEENLEAGEKRLYTGALHAFGRAGGTAIYAVLKGLLREAREVGAGRMAIDGRRDQHAG